MVAFCRAENEFENGDGESGLHDDLEFPQHNRHKSPVELCKKPQVSCDIKNACSFDGSKTALIRLHEPEHIQKSG
jgi:hypothetical protein